MRSSRSFKHASLALALIAALPLPALAAPTVNDALDKIAVYAPQALKQQGAPGMVLAITDATHTVRILPVGYEDLTAKIPVTEHTRFGIGSISKSMTATALLELRDAGTFDPHKPVTAYLPWFSIHSQWRAITPHDLFTHTSGMPDGGLSTGFSAVYGLRDWMTGFAPGTHWSYSNVGYDTLGAILETLDRSNYATIMQRRVFSPLGMSDTTAEWSPQTLESAANGYLYRADEGPTPPDPLLMTSPTTHFIDPAGSVLSTGEDMAKYMRFLLNGGKAGSTRLLSPESFTLLTSPGVTDGHQLGDAGPGMYHRYGYGLAIMNVGGDTVVAHTGGVLSYTSCIMVDLTRGFGAIAMSNLGYVGPRPCAIVNYAIEALQAQSEGKALPPVPPVPDPAHVEHPEDYPGSYTAGAAAFTVQAHNDRLSLTQNGTTVALYPRGKDDFYADSPAFSQFDLTFGRDKNGKVVEAFYGPQWFTNAQYAGPKSFTYPAEWSGYTGEYESMDPNGYFNAVHVYEVKGKLVMDGAQLVPQGGSLFHIGTQMWEPSWVRFTEPIAGRTQLITSPGQTLYRINPY